MKNAKFLKASIACLLGMGALSLVGASIVKNEVTSTPVEAANSYDSYYSDVDTSSASNLLSSLRSIISSPFNSLGYDGLWTAYGKTDVKSDGYIFDWYSKISKYKLSDHGSSSATEGTGGYNREHSIPKSWWGGSTSNQGCDVIIVVPTDVHVNSMRSNYPFGEVGNTTYTSEGGYCKLGYSKTTISGYSDKVFEPSDDLKGDFARIYFYAVTRWSTTSWSGGNSTVVFANSLSSPNYGLTSYAKDLFVKWHDEDPVDDWERARNNAVQETQKNRNPYIDHPEYVDQIWGGTTPSAKTVTNLTLTGSLTKSTYVVGESFDPTGLTVTATYDDGTTGNVTNSVTWNPSTIAAGTTSVTGSYGGKTVTVNGISIKTLTSLSVSGSPTKTTYTAGQSFNPAGLTVTATYSDTSTEVVTSSVTWTPAKLTEGTTSVTGSYGGKTVTVNGLTVEAAPAGEGFTLFEDDIEEGDYVIADETNALAAENSGSRIKAETISVNSDKVTDPSDTVIWHIEEDEDGYYTVYNTKNSVYAASNGTKNQGTVSGTLDDKALWTISQNSGKFEFVNKYNKAGSINANLRFNNAGPYFGTYGTNTGHPLTLYKGTTGGSEKTLESITVSNPTTTYTVGDSFIKPTVTAHYSDSSSETVSDATFSGYDMSTAGNQTVTVTYQGKTTTYGITVSAPIVTLESISVSGQTTSFTVGDTFSFGGTVTAHYSDSSSTNVTASAEFDGYDMSTAGNQTVTVTYQGKTTTYSITVKSGTTPTPVGGTATYTVTSKTAVSSNGAPTGSSATFSQTYTGNAGQITNGTTTTLVLSGYAGTKITKITLNMKSNTSKGGGSFSAVAGSTTISSISDSKFNTNNWNGAWSTSYVDVIPSMSNASYAIQNNENVTLTITASESSLYISSYTIEYESASSPTPTKTLTSITVDNPTTTYTVGDSFIKPTVTAHYSDDSTDDVTASTTFSGYDMSTAGTQTVTATYEGKTATYSITVKSGTTAQTITDEITSADLTATGTSYSAFSNVTKESGAKYAGTSAKDASANIQLRIKNSDSGIVSTVSGGKIKSIQITVGTGTNQIDVYGSNTAYTAAADLFDSAKQGTLLGSVRETGTITVTGDYQYVGLRSNTGAIYVASIKFVWAASGSSEDTPEELAEAWATEFLNAFTCDAAGISAPSKSIWAAQAASYNALDADVKALFVAATYTISGSGSATVVTPSDGVNQKVAEAVARYDYVIRKYSVNDYENFMSRSVTSSNMLGKKNIDNQDMRIVLIGLVSFTAIAMGCIKFYKKQKEN